MWLAAERDQPAPAALCAGRRFRAALEKSAGVGTVVAMMLPYAAATMLAWALLFFAWYFLGLPWGP
jgi:p-aminobenzoyl-glutamate transporter AbgT